MAKRKWCTERSGYFDDTHLALVCELAYGHPGRHIVQWADFAYEWTAAR